MVWFGLVIKTTATTTATHSKLVLEVVSEEEVCGGVDEDGRRTGSIENEPITVWRVIVVDVVDF